MSDGLMIAVVDDDESARDATVDLVRSLGFGALGFGSAAAFLESQDLQELDCLIADVRMPGMGGVELHLTLAGLALPIPTILMTAFPDDRVRARAMAAGVKCYIEKPLEADHLLSCIRTAIGHSDGQGDRDTGGR